LQRLYDYAALKGRERRDSETATDDAAGKGKRGRAC
jgi:hypothetical protein